MFKQACPCGSGGSYDGCCGRLHRGEATAATAAELMRARYAAYVVNEPNYVFRTWHPRTRPDDLSTARSDWTSLEILDVAAGGADDETGEVEFVARHPRGTMHERSRFERRRREWVYVNGEQFRG